MRPAGPGPVRTDFGRHIHGPRTGDVFVELVRRGHARTRRDLAELTGLSRSMVAHVVADLVAEGRLVESAAEGTGDSRRSRGRPSTVLAVERLAGIAAGIDVSHQRIAIALGDLNGEQLAEDQWSFAADRDAAASLAFAEERLRSLMAAKRLPLRLLRSVVFSIPFPVVHGDTVQPLGHTPGWRGARPQSVSSLPRGVAVAFENDADLGAWGEFVHAADPALRDLIYVKVGDGLGAGAVLDGRLLAGGSGMVGEIGHVTVPGCRLVCRCGRIGCLDALVSEANAASADSVAVARAGRALGSLVAQIAAFLDPRSVVIGGDLGASTAFVSAVRAEFTARSAPHQQAALRAAALEARAERVGALDRAVQLAWAARVRPGIGRIRSI